MKNNETYNDRSEIINILCKHAPMLGSSIVRILALSNWEACRLVKQIGDPYYERSHADPDFSHFLTEIEWREPNGETIE